MIAERSGYVTEVDALAIGIATVQLGAGRARKQDAIDHSTGVVCCSKRGGAIEAGSVIAVVHARSADEADQTVAAVQNAYKLGEEAPPASPLVLEFLT